MTRILDMKHMRAAKATVLFDLGMGLGKLLLQSFFQYPNIRYVCGVELALSRYRIAEKALLKLVELEVRSAFLTGRASPFALLIACVLCVRLRMCRVEIGGSPIVFPRFFSVIRTVDCCG